MFLLDDVWEEAVDIVGTCNERRILQWLSDAVSLVTNKQDLEGLKGYLDICTTGGQCVTLPREVDAVVAVNIGGRPTLAYDQLFRFHLNGPGDCRTPCSWSWDDQGGFHPVLRDIVTPSKLVTYLQTPEDNGKKVLVFGYDVNGNRLRRQVAGVWMDGYQVPTIFGYSIPETTAPVVARIVAVEKEITVGNIRLGTIDSSGTTGTLLGIYEPDERLPQYRRIKLNRACKWVRIAYRKTTPVFQSRFDHVPLRSRLALINALRAVKFYGDPMLGEAQAFEAHAARMEAEAQRVVESPTYMPIQVVDLNNINDKDDLDIR